MPTYDFACKKCEEGFELVFSMKDDEGRNNAACPKCGEKLKRIFTSPYALVKGTETPTEHKTVGKDQHFVDVDGKKFKMNFIDHGDTGEKNRALEAALGIPGGIRTDEKTGKKVVDVISDVPDPLGKIEEAKAAGVTEVTKKKVGQKYKVRGKKK